MRRPLLLYVVWLRPRQRRIDRTRSTFKTRGGEGIRINVLRIRTLRHDASSLHHHLSRSKLGVDQSGVLRDVARMGLLQRFLAGGIRILLI